MIPCGVIASGTEEDVREYIMAAVRKDNYQDYVVFDDVRYLNELLQDLNWENSEVSERRDLYQRLISVVNEINETEKLSLDEILQQRVDDAQDEYDAARDTERSTANKLLGGASMAAMGIGGMELASALSEKNAIEYAEMQMKAYLATFRCDWADGKSVAGGETAIELPGGNELISLVGEYKSLAADLKVRKEALGLKPGVESEEILDSATAGLYDDKLNGKADGAFTSLARALSDETSEDAAKWAADKNEVNEKLKKSTTTVVVAAVASVAANLAINGVSNSKATVNKAETVRDETYQVLDAIINSCNEALIANSRINEMIIGYENLYKIKDLDVCKN